MTQKLSKVLGRLVTNGLALLGALVVIVMLTPITAWWARALAGPWNDPRGDTLIVLGGGMLEDGTIANSSYWRTVYASRAYREGSFRNVVLSGGGGQGKSVAEGMRDFMRCQGVPPDVILLELKSTNTHENALYIKNVVEHLPGSKVLMTSDYHMLRAYRAFRKMGIDVLPRPLPDALKRVNVFSDRWSVFLDLSRETAALVYYYARGWI